MKAKHIECKVFDVLKKISLNRIILPSIQRDFIWEKKQVVALFDSIMLGYPISTFLFWNLEEFDFSQNTYFYQFLKDVTFNFQGKAQQTSSSMIDSKVLDANTIAVLDGQQRLTSLYVSLLGQAKTKEKYKRSSGALNLLDLYLDLSSGSDFFDDEELIEDDNDAAVKESNTYTFDFQLLISNPDKKKWFKVRDVLKLQDKTTRETEINKILSTIEPSIALNAKNNLSLLARRIFDDDIINVSELSECELDEALEIFIRFNRGGTQLSKSDLVFSTIESRWPEAKDRVEKYLSNLNGNKYNFNKDFIVRLALVLFGKNRDIQKTIINNEIVKQLRTNWANITNAINKTVEFLSSNVGITSNREISSYTSIIPIVYSIYNNNCKIENEKDIKKYIYRSLILNIFSRRTSALLIDLKKIIKESEFLISIEDIESKLFDFKVGEERIEQILDYEKSFTTQLTLFLMGNNNVFQSRDGGEYHQDHIHAFALFDDDNQQPYGISDIDWKKWGKMRNKLPNLQLLKGKPNQKKSKKLLDNWLDSSDAPTEVDFRNALNLPNDLSLKLRDFEVFYAYRKEKLMEQLREMLL
ncbi:hypothetical protein FACS189485_00400 [Spirochaetia bacterium]|nr:hypothetical protein FACS189485_00400 [Spirochaetia bacterium]